MTALKLIHSQDGLIMKHIHIIGIGGTFMGGVAAIAKEAGFKVSGCDAKMYPPMSTQLEALGIDIHEGFDAAQLDEFKADIYVIGNVAKRGMDVIEAILNKGLPYTSGARPAYSKTHASMEAVVVLPCVPATPSTQCRCNTFSASHCGPEV